MKYIRSGRAIIAVGLSGLILSACNGDGTGDTVESSNVKSIAIDTASAVAVATGAWNGTRFQIDRPNLIGRSDIVLEKPNINSSQAMPLGNGRLGVAIWSANGFTAQLNRGDTLPDRLSPGQVVIPGLAAITSASNYRGILDLYNGEFRESGGGMTATAYVQPNTDTLVIDVTGADPGKVQTVSLNLWSPRNPTASIVDNRIGVLSEKWQDGTADDKYDSSGQSFGSLAAISAVASGVSVSTTSDSRSTTLSFKPNADGTFRIIVGVPHYDGSQAVPILAQDSITDTSSTKHTQSWNTFWSKAGLIKLTSSDGSGEYMENLRNIYLYSAQAGNQDNYPGSQAGVADLFSSVEDYHRWYPFGYWHWNLRMQIAANMQAGLYYLNAPYFNLYQQNLANLQDWTTKKMAGRPGICVPEVMRFNGNGNVMPVGPDTKIDHSSCDASSRSYFNSRTLSTGAEISHFIWIQYLATKDLEFLKKNYPIMENAAAFLHAYQKTGSDNLLHTSPTNAHETQWDTKDSTTDIAAIHTLFTDTLSASQVMRAAGQTINTSLLDALKNALPQTPEYPRTQSSGTLSLLSSSADSAGTDVIADSYNPAQARMNSENIGLEPIWPYDQIGDTSPLFELAKRTYKNRPYSCERGCFQAADWNFDPIDAARLQNGGEVKKTLLLLTKFYQKYVNGFAQSSGTEPYVEQIGIVSTALAESLVQDYDGVIRIAPAIAPGWDYDGTVFVRDNTKVDVQVREGKPVTVVIEPGSNAQLTVRNPWPGKVVTASSAGKSVSVKSQGSDLILQPIGPDAIVLQSASVNKLPIAPISGAVATVAKRLDSVQIGIPSS
uniref:hypothetical protein n=1 Tax=Burkholderia arboris TaxID=488730 RepID=UPI003BEECF71